MGDNRSEAAVGKRPMLEGPIRSLGKRLTQACPLARAALSQKYGALLRKHNGPTGRHRRPAVTLELPSFLLETMSPFYSLQFALVLHTCAASVSAVSFPPFSRPRPFLGSAHPLVRLLPDAARFVVFLFIGNASRKTVPHRKY